MGLKNQVTLTFAGDHKDLEKTTDKVGSSVKQVNKEVESSSQKFKRWNKVAVGASLAVVGGAVAVGKSLLDAGREGVKVEKQLDQVFESMGGKGSSTFKDLANQTDDLSKRLAQPGTEIQKVQTKLATFGKVWEDQAKGPENFARATELAFDLEAAGFGAAESNIQQLGRALNDPIKGMTALTRSGISFTEAEKEKIKQLQESGDLLGAQEMVYKALEEQVGGVAEAGVDGGDRLNASWENFQDTLGRKLIPAFESLMAIGMTVLTWASDNTDLLLTLGGVVVGLAGFVLVANAAWKVYVATMKAVTLATKAYTIAQRALNLAMRANPIGVIITLLGLLATGITIAWRKSETFRKIVTGAWRAIRRAALGAWNNVLKPLLQWHIELPGKIASAFGRLASIITSPFRTAFRAVKNLWNATAGGFGFDIPSWVPGVGGRSFRIPNMHRGGIVPGAPGQERLMMMEAGERVTPAVGVSGGRTVIELRSGGTALDDALVEILARSIQVRGGDVQLVLGGADG